MKRFLHIFSILIVLVILICTAGQATCTDRLQTACDDTQTNKDITYQSGDNTTTVKNNSDTSNISGDKSDNNIKSKNLPETERSELPNKEKPAASTDSNRSESDTANKDKRKPKDNAAESNKNTKNDRTINSDDFYWLSRIIHAEAANEPYEGKLAVGSVIVNRVKSSEFPSNIKDVIFDKKYGVQFTPTINGAIYNTPSDDSFKAAKEILEGKILNHDIMYFVNHNISTLNWFYTLKFEFRIGDHWFYS